MEDKSMEDELQDEFSKSNYVDAVDFLVDKIRDYENAFEYINEAIYRQHCTMNHQENTDYERGRINGLIQAGNIVDKGKERYLITDRMDE